MIVFELICGGGHRFEGWFGSADDFESQKIRGLLTCPSCASSSVSKLPTAKIKRGAEEPAPSLPVPQATGPAPTKEQLLMALVERILTTAENVGDKFPEEARRIHREEAPVRSIRGVASKEQAEELLDEGIPVLPLPVPPTGEWQ